MRLAIEGDRRLTVRELENDLGIPKTTVWEIFTENLGMTRVCAKFIPKLLTTEQKDLRSEIAQDNLEMVSEMKMSLRRLLLVMSHGFISVPIKRRKKHVKSEPCQVSADYFFRL